MAEVPAIPVDPHLPDDESVVDDASLVESSTASLSESIREYRRIHDRTYTQKTDYWGPNDEKQNEGLDISHHWMTLLFDGKLVMAPIGKKPKAFLDIGTGTGTWALDVASEYPETQVIGIDISPIQPSWVPPNVTFQIDDIELDWTFSSTQQFDLIHIRNLEASIKDWPLLYSRAFKQTVPGTGYVQVIAFDITTRSQTFSVNNDPDHVFKQWANLMFEAGDKMGKSFRQHQDHAIKKGLEEAGYVDVVEQKLKVPIGSWSADKKLKEIGAYNLLFIDQSLEGFALFLLNMVLGWKIEDIHVFVDKMRRAVRDGRNTPYYELHLVYGRRPE
ncbi:secondary metabolism regulator LAE1 [Rhypophila sp. PSN 637]